jgi:uncharacterized membrane protein
MDEEPARWHREPTGRTHRQTEPRERRRAHRTIVGVGSLSVLAGMLLLVIVGGVVASILGAALIGLSAIAFVSLIFLLVRESEEDDRLRHPHG